MLPGSSPGSSTAVSSGLQDRGPHDRPLALTVHTNCESVESAFRNGIFKLPLVSVVGHNYLVLEIL